MTHNEKIKSIISELEEFFPFIIQLDKYSWKVEHEAGKKCCSFSVNILPDGTLVMSGDYGGIMVQPHCGRDLTINWMAGATSEGYFAEKVWNANKNHKVDEYSEEEAREYLEDTKCDVLAHSGEDMSEEDFDDEYIPYDLEREAYFLDAVSKIDEAFPGLDVWEGSDAKIYTERFRLQHKYLLFFANKVLEIRSMGDGLKELLESKNKEWVGLKNPVENINPDPSKYLFEIVDHWPSHVENGWENKTVYEVSETKYCNHIAFVILRRLERHLEESADIVFDYEFIFVDKMVSENVSWERRK